MRGGVNLYKGLLFVFVLICLFSTSHSLGACQYQTSDGQYFYDLSPLSKCDGTGYFIVNSNNITENFTINFCAALQVANCFPGSSVCYSNFKGTSSLGYFNDIAFSALAKEDQGVILTYTNGQGCLNTTSTTVIQVACGENTNTPKITFVNESPQCVFNFKVTTQYGCPTKPANQNVTCQTIVPLNVFVVPHSHDDVGWLLSPSSYYTSEVRYIITTVVEELIKNPARKFIQVEQYFFTQWWNDIFTTDQMRNNVQTLVKNKQLEFVLGGYVMPDEACTTYSANIDQLTLGHTFLKETFNVTPDLGWQIDPFGASEALPTLQSLAGFRAHAIDRINFELKETLKSQRMLEFIWQGSASLGNVSNVFTHMLDENYCAPMLDGFDYEGTEPDNPWVDPDDIQSISDRFAEEAYKRQGWARTPNILLPYGCDFRYQNATKQFFNMDQIIKYISENPERYNINIKYTLLSDYFDTVINYGINWPVYQGDFFPYDDDENSWWVGYYTSRSQLKEQVRYSEAVLRASENILTSSVLQNVISSWSQELSLVTVLREAVAEVQHHDGVTGTEKQVVANAYSQDLTEGTILSSNSNIDLIQQISNIGYGQPYLTLDPISLNNLANGQSIAMVVYNSLSWTRTDFVRVPLINKKNYVVTDVNGNTVPSQINPAFILPDGVLASYYLYIQVNLPPLGFTTYFITAVSSQNKFFKSSHINGALAFNNQFLEVDFDSNGNLNAIINNGSKINLKVSQDFLVYHSWSEGGQNSGAYIFRPDGPAALLSTKKPNFTIAQGGFVNEIYQVFPSNESQTSFAKQVIRLFSSGDKFLGNFIEIEHDIGPLPIEGAGREFITRFTTNLNTANTIFTDDNGYEFIKRVYDPSISLSIAGNYFPSVYSNYIQDTKSNNQFSFVSTSSHGVATLENGRVEAMLHRRCLLDDGRGVDEPLNESTIIYPKLRLIVENPDNSAELRYRQTYLLNFPPIPFFSSIIPPKSYVNNYRTTFSLVTQSLPPNIHLLSSSIVSLGESNSALFRFAHLFGVGEHQLYSQPTTVNATQLFGGLGFNSVVETTLTGNRIINSNFNPNSWFVILLPKQIRTFLVQF